MTFRNQSGSFSAANNPTLEPRHLRIIEERGITIEVAKGARLATVGKHEGANLLNFDNPLKSGALAIPYQYESGAVADYWRLRMDEGDVRYLSPKAAVRPYVPWPAVLPIEVLRDVSITLHIVEAPLKALSLCSFAFHSIGLGGVSTGHDTKLWKESKKAQLHPELILRINWSGRPVILIFDANRATNPEVAEGEARLVWALYNAGCSSVRVVQLPVGDEVGPDDFLAQLVAFYLSENKTAEEARQKAADAFSVVILQAKEADPQRRLSNLLALPDKQERAETAQELLGDLPFLASLYLRGVDSCEAEFKKLGIKLKSVKQKVKEYKTLLRDYRNDFAESPKEELRQIKMGTDLHRIVDESIEALSTSENIYQRAGELVIVVCHQEASEGSNHNRKAPIIRGLPAPGIREHLTRVALFIYWSEKSDGWVASLPPEPVVQALAVRRIWAGVREIKGVREAPFLRPDGSVCQTAGFDEKTGFFLAPSERFPAVPENPTREEAVAACSALLETICDFPFSSDMYRSAWLAIVLTLFARPAIVGACPLFALDANTRGSGKSRLTDIAAILVTGREATRTTQPENDDEMRKRITALLMEGEPFAVLDNVKRALGGGALEALITTPAEWKDRVLGQTVVVNAPALTVWACSGNNLSFTDDLIRRTLHIRLESPLEHPEDRDIKEFKHPDLIGWVKQERPRLVAAALTLLRAWYVAGQPKPAEMRQWGSFEAWSSIVPPCLCWVGLPDPISAHRELSSQAYNAGPIVGFLQELSALLAKKKVSDLSARELVTEAYPDRGLFKNDYDATAPFRSALEGIAQGRGGKVVTANGLGYSLRTYKGRVFSLEGKEISLDCRYDRIKTARWYVKQYGTQEMRASAGDILASNPSVEKSDGDNRHHNNLSELREAVEHPLQITSSPAVSTLGVREEVFSEESLTEEELSDFRLRVYNLQFDHKMSEAEAKEEALADVLASREGRL